MGKKSVEKKPRILGIKLTPARLKFMLNMYPPYIGAGVRVDYISDDWREFHVSMRMHWYTKNAVNTHFGGSLYSMVDPHLMLLLMQLLGSGYMVWDKSATIDFIKPSRKTVRAKFKISDDDLVNIRQQTAQGDKYLAHFLLELKDEDDVLLAKVDKVLYIRKKQPPAG